MATHPTSQPKSAPAKPAEKTPRLLADNRKAGFDFEYLEQFEAGVVLLGTEVKAIREGQVNLRDSYARVEASEVWVYNIHISPYSHRGYAEHEALRRRKLLLNRAEIRKLIGRTVEKGLTLVPTRMYLKNGRVKINIALARGKKAHDKRDAIKKKDIERDTRQEARERHR
jgi:SsrA-binding protein